MRRADSPWRTTAISRPAVTISLPCGSIAGGMATIAIGDIHGQVKPLCDLLERVRPNISAGDTVVFLGDYIDRGRDTRACIDAILEFRRSVPATVVVPARQPRRLDARDARRPLAPFVAARDERAHAPSAATRRRRPPPSRPPRRGARAALYDGAMHAAVRALLRRPAGRRTVRSSTRCASSTRHPSASARTAASIRRLDSLAGQVEALIWGAPRLSRGLHGRASGRLRTSQQRRRRRRRLAAPANHRRHVWTRYDRARRADRYTIARSLRAAERPLRAPAGLRRTATSAKERV